MRNAHCYVTTLLYLSFFMLFLLHIYILVGQLAPLPPYPWRLPSHLIRGGATPARSVFSPNQICFSPGNGLRVRLPGKVGADAGDMRFF